MADLEREFQKAKKDADCLVNCFISKDQELKIYALYTQATVGDCDHPHLELSDPKEKAKHESWSSMKGMSKDEAKKEYIEIVQELIVQNRKMFRLDVSIPVDPHISIRRK